MLAENGCEGAGTPGNERSNFAAGHRVADIKRDGFYVKVPECTVLVAELDRSGEPLSSQTTENVT